MTRYRTRRKRRKKDCLSFASCCSNSLPLTARKEVVFLQKVEKCRDVAECDNDGFRVMSPPESTTDRANIKYEVFIRTAPQNKQMAGKGRSHRVIVSYYSQPIKFKSGVKGILQLVPKLLLLLFSKGKEKDRASSKACALCSTQPRFIRCMVMMAWLRKTAGCPLKGKIYEGRPLMGHPYSHFWKPSLARSGV